MTGNICPLCSGYSQFGHICSKCAKQHSLGAALTQDHVAGSGEEKEFPAPTWATVQQAFVDGAREATANPTASEHDFKRASDGYVKLQYHNQTGKFSA